ncbi:MAG: hypothetical protein AB8H79_07880 [Myxococcota bacterium]
MRTPRTFAVALAAVYATSCAGGAVDLSRPVRFDPDAPIPDELSDLNLFGYDGAGGFTYNDRIAEYDLNTPLFTDYALKSRAIYLPPGTTAGYDEDRVLDFPVGTILMKSFLFAADYRQPDKDLTLVETRLLIRHDSEWRAFPYIWDADQLDATLSPGGGVRQVPFLDALGDPHVSSYLVPARNQCQTCHQRREDRAATSELTPLGPKARNLNRDHDYAGAIGVVNQLQHFAERGLLTGAPAAQTVPQAYRFDEIEASGVTDLSYAELDRAARSYLDVNCGHCHHAQGRGQTSSLFLNLDNTQDLHLRSCDSGPIIPGHADASSLIFRVETEQLGSMMPRFGRSVTHQRGVEMLRAWIDRMPPGGCEPAP